MSLHLRPALLLLALVAPAGAAPPASPAPDKYGPWEAVRDESGIQVHRRKVQGNSLHEFRGRGVVEAPIPPILGVLRDADRRTEWMHKCAGSRLVEQVSETVQIGYNRTGAPWPVSHRDTVLHGEVIFDAAKRQVRVVFHNVEHPKEPPAKGVVRMPFLRGHWILEPIDGGRATRVEYQVHADPGGSLPDWISNLVSKQIPWKTIVGMREQVKRRRYPDFEKWLMATPEYQSVVPAPAAAPPATVPAPTSAVAL